MDALPPLGHASNASPADVTDSQAVDDRHTFVQLLRRARAAPMRDDLDHDGVVSKGEMLVRRLRDMAAMLALDAIVRPGAVDPVRLAKAVQLVNGLADQLARRITGKEPYTEEDLVDIAGEAVDILHWAAASASHATKDDDPANDSRTDGKVEWRPDRAANELRVRAFIERMSPDAAA
jgi:hypothetical protein